MAGGTEHAIFLFPCNGNFLLKTISHRFYQSILFEEVKTRNHGILREPQEKFDRYSHENPEDFNPVLTPCIKN